MKIAAKDASGVDKSGIAAVDIVDKTRHELRSEVDLCLKLSNMVFSGQNKRSDSFYVPEKISTGRIFVFRRHPGGLCGQVLFNQSFSN